MITLIKNKIINLCQFLVVAAAVQNNIIIEKKSCLKEKVFPHNQSVYKYFLIWLTRIISTMKCKQKSATRKVHLIFSPYEMRAKQFSLQIYLDDFEMFDGTFLMLLLLSNFKHHSIDFIYYRWLVFLCLSKVRCGCMQHEISIFIDCPSFFC